jgi:hypothetical protein
MDAEIKFRLPTWMKARATEHARHRGKALSDWLRDLVLREVGPLEPPPKKR